MNASMIRVPAMICLFSLLGFSGPATAQEARERPEGRERRQPTLTVTGEGEASARPDRAVVQLGAVAQAEHASAAQQQVNQPMESAIKLIRELGIPEESITTVGLMLSPVYSEARPPREHLQAQPRIVGYRASNRIRVEIDNLDRIGAVIDAGLQAGANHVEDLSFRLKDETAARSEALRLASKRARRDRRGDERANRAGPGSFRGGRAHHLTANGICPWDDGRRRCHAGAAGAGAGAGDGHRDIRDFAPRRSGGRKVAAEMYRGRCLRPARRSRRADTEKQQLQQQAEGEYPRAGTAAREDGKMRPFKFISLHGEHPPQRG
jgi:uncharacterized protein YggE